MQIQEYKGRVSINGHKIVGQITDAPCSRCGQRLVYADKYDANFCPAENIWADDKCGDSTCALCRRRPDKPLPETQKERHDHYY